MNVRERILTIQLLNKINANPAAAKKLGIIWENSPGELGDQANACAERIKSCVHL